VTNSELYTAWYWSLAVAGVVVLIAAALLIAIVLVARSIQNHAQQAIEAAEHIAADTQVIWALAESNRVAAEILDATASIERHGGGIVETLHEPRAAAS